MAIDINKIQPPKSSSNKSANQFNLAYWLNRDISLSSGGFGDVKILARVKRFVEFHEPTIIVLRQQGAHNAKKNWWKNKGE